MSVQGAEGLRNQFDREELRKLKLLVAMLESPNTNEREIARDKIDRMLARNGLAWGDVTLLATVEYHERGWGVVPLQPGTKKTVHLDWPSKNYRLIDFEPENNVGVKMGEASNGLIDVDLDCPEAVALAPEVLPATGAMFGRPSRRSAHWLYYSCRRG
jgi:hypothetical protein